MALDPENPRLTQSEFDRFDLAYAKKLKEDFPKIWKAGGNIRGNEAFEYWVKYSEGDRGEGVLDWIKEREAWSARHYEDGSQFKSDDLSPNLSNVAGIVAQIKWGTVGSLGEKRMKEVINTLKKKVNNTNPKIIQAKAEGIEVVLSGEVGSWEVSAKQIASAIQGKTDQPLTIKINSVGGDVFEGFALYNAIKSHQGPTTAIVEGIAASAASLFAMAADSVVMNPASLLMIHNPWMLTGGDSKDLRSAADTLDKIKEIMVERYSEKTGQTAETLSQLLDEETYLTPSEAVELGFADRINHSEDHVESLSNSVYNKIKEMFKSKDQIIQNLTSEEVKEIASRLDVKDSIEMIKALADNLEGIEEVCVKLEGVEKYMSSPEVAVIPMEGHAMLLALGVLEEREVEAMEDEEEKAMEEEEEKAMEEEEKEAKEEEYKSEIQNLTDLVGDLKASIETLKEERAAMSISNSEKPQEKPLNMNQMIIANAFKNKK